MYPSGDWSGYWEQRGYGRQPMQQFELQFSPNGAIRGRGEDIVGVFVITGTWHPKDGSFTWIKKYIGKHEVLYSGNPTGEGTLCGTWRVVDTYGSDSGNFAIAPVVPRPDAADPILTIG